MRKERAVKLHQPVPIHTFLHLLLFEDRDVFRMLDSWKIERKEVYRILITYYHSLGIYSVKPDITQQLLRDDVLLQLKQNPILLQKKNIAPTR